MMRPTTKTTMRLHLLLHLEDLLKAARDSRSGPHVEPNVTRISMGTTYCKAALELICACFILCLVHEIPVFIIVPRVHPDICTRLQCLACFEPNNLITFVHPIHLNPVHVGCESYSPLGETK